MTRAPGNDLPIRVRAWLCRWYDGAVEIRRASSLDAAAIARLHAESWRENYRGAYSDDFLDGDVFADRRTVWSDRLQSSDPKTITLVAEQGDTLVGFAHTILDSDPIFGALLDNLHVATPVKGTGLGRALMAATADAVIASRPGSGLYLWVLEQNVAAQGFYRRLGGVFADRETSDAPGGGAVVGLRAVWDDPARMLADDEGGF